MAKSYKSLFMSILAKGYKKYIVSINNNDVELYTNHYDELMNSINLDDIAKENGLKGKMKPTAIIQYFTIAPWDSKLIPMVAFVWSWGGPWAYIYNINYPELSESGSVPLNRVAQSIEI